MRAQNAMGEPAPPLSILLDTDIIHLIKYIRPSPFLHTPSDQKLDGGKVWERGYDHTQLEV